jgi:hypothetical protein
MARGVDLLGKRRAEENHIPVREFLLPGTNTANAPDSCETWRWPTMRLRVVVLKQDLAMLPLADEFGHALSPHEEKKLLDECRKFALLTSSPLFCSPYTPEHE